MVAAFTNMTQLTIQAGVKPSLLATLTLPTSLEKNLGRLNMAHLNRKLMKTRLPFLLLLLCTLLVTSSCQTYMADFFPGRPDKRSKVDDDASVEFKQGWKDGCETGMSGGSNTFYKIFYHSNKADGYKMTSSSDYKVAWGNAFWYCYRHDFVKQKSSIWGSYFTGLR